MGQRGGASVEAGRAENARRESRRRPWGEGEGLGGGGGGPSPSKGACEVEAQVGWMTGLRGLTGRAKIARGNARGGEGEGGGGDGPWPVLSSAIRRIGEGTAEEHEEEEDVLRRFGLTCETTINPRVC